VLRKLTLRIDDDDRIAILGANGQGKSTLVKAISGRLAPLDGNVYRHKKLKIAYFAQHQLDELNPAGTPYSHVRALMEDATEAQVRSRTALLGFGPDKADVTVAKLSGGEKARLLFGLIAFEGPHLMILDEPTNHLDIDSRDALIEALNTYQGAVLLITHDAHIAEAVADRLWEVKNGEVLRLDEDLGSYRERILAAGRTQPGAAREKPRASQADQRRAAAELRKALQPLKDRVTKAEKTMEKAAAELARIDTALAEPDLFTKHLDKATALSQARARWIEAQTAAEEEWLEASAAYEAAMAAGNAPEPA
jgi:ATP-binding cassette subfamily F protein 3